MITLSRESRSLRHDPFSVLTRIDAIGLWGPLGLGKARWAVKIFLRHEKTDKHMLAHKDCDTILV